MRTRNHDFPFCYTAKKTLVIFITAFLVITSCGPTQSTTPSPLPPSPTPTPTPLPIPGDVDGNGLVDIRDAQVAMLYFTGRIDVVPRPENLDITGDGQIDTADAFQIAQNVTGRSRIVLAMAEYGIQSTIYAGALVRVEVFEPSLPEGVTGGIARIKSNDMGYDTGDLPLTFERNGLSLYTHWDTGGLPVASDYEVYLTLTGSSLNNLNQAETIVALSQRPYETSQLTQAQDAFAPAPGISLTFQRVFPHDSASGLYLGPLGRGWVHNYDIHLQEFTDGRIAFFGAGGLNRWFVSNDNGTYLASPGDYGVLTRDPDGTFQLREKDGFIYRFRSDLRLDYLIDTYGNSIQAIYNTDNQLVEVRHSSGQSFRFEYNEHGRISKLIDQVGRETIYTYDDAGDHLLSVTAPADRVTTYTYSLGLGIANEHRLLSITYPDGTHLTFAYDFYGRLISQEGDEGIGRIEYIYDTDGTTHITTAVGSETIIRVNDHLQPVEVINPLGAITRYGYDPSYNLVEVTDPLDHTSSYEYDDRGNITQFTDPLGNIAHFGYEDQFNNMTWISDSRGGITSFSYNSHGKLTSITYPDGSTERFTYDAHGSLQSRTDRSGNTISYTYDERGLLLSKIYPDGSIATFSYDEAGNLVSAENNTGIIYFEYDEINRLTQVTYPGNRTFRYEYNATDERTRMIDPDGKILVYQYDTAGRPERILDDAGALVVEYQYDAANQRTRKTLGNGAYTTYEYDDAGQILKLVNYDPTGHVISFFYYEYDLVGNRMSSQTTEGTEIYAYDALSQLVEVTYPDGTRERFVYDPAGNRLSVTDNGEQIYYSVNELNQYITVGDTTYQYDDNGNLISKTEDGQTTYYDYDYENRLISVRLPNKTVTYTYDPFGLRNGRRDGDGLIQYLWDENQIVIEENDVHQTTASYTWGNALDEVIRMQRGSDNYYYALDAILSVSDLLDTSGISVEHYQYRAYGEPSTVSSVGNIWLFTGSSLDSQTGLQYNRFRYYIPQLGRFTSNDPVGLYGGLNLYTYARNNPVVYSDPFGLWEPDPPDPSTTYDPRVWNPKPLSEPRLDLEVPHWLPPPGWTTVHEGSVISNIRGRFYTGGACPTFIQLPSVGTLILPTVRIDVSQEQLSGEITVPAGDALLRSDIPIFGVAGGTNFREYRVEYGEGRNPTEWHLIASSNIPQPTTDVGLAEMHLMQGDIDIRGNLATWNTGLKNWSHLPWHPPEDPTDLNGVYTLRLVVIGQDGQTVEDRMTVEVGRAIAQGLPGIAISPDQRVVMRFPEQALTYPFRVYTILPLSDTGESAPTLPAGTEPIGPVYRIREPGDRFIKDVTLEFTASSAEIGQSDIGQVGIVQYDANTGEWLWLPTVSAQADDAYIFSTSLSELPSPKAIYMLAFDSQNASRSRPRPDEQPTSAPIVPVAPGVLIWDTFESGFGLWAPRDRFVGAVIIRDDAVTNDGSYALRITNESYGGNFSVTALAQPFDVQEYPLLTFDYRIGPGVKTDFYFLVNGRWYNLGFTDDPVDFYTRDVNIANLGQIEGILADDQWHTASVNVYELLRQRTRNTRVDAIMLADWDVGGYMKLEFGHNARGASFYIDNFTITSDPSRYEIPDILVVDTFESSETVNFLGGPSGTFSNPNTNYCQSNVVADTTGSAGNHALEVVFDTTRSGAYCGYWTALMAADLNGMSEVSLRLRSLGSIPPMQMGLRQASTMVEAKVPLGPYLRGPDESGWWTAHIPLTAFLGRGLPDLSLMDTLFVSFENDNASGQGIIFLDDLGFDREATFAEVADFNVYPMNYNLLGGGFSTTEAEAATISAGYFEIQTEPLGTTTGAMRISFGGNIGLDYGAGRFSYAIWETDLLGFDAREFQYLVLEIKGEHGGESPNIYLDDGTTRRPVRASEILLITKDWQEVQIPLERFASQGIDLSQLEALQLAFEWEEMSGTIYISEIFFAGGTP